MTGAQASRLQLPPTMQEKQCKRDACGPVNSNRGRIALSPSQPGLNPRSSHDNRTYNCFFNLGDVTSSPTSPRRMAMTVPRLSWESTQLRVVRFSQESGENPANHSCKKAHACVTVYDMVASESEME